MHILVCDDEEEILDTLKISLEKIGCKVTTAESGNSAMCALSIQRFDAVLTDYWMQKGDGGDLAEYCIKNNMPCAIMTGFLGSDVTSLVPSRTTVIGKLELIELLLPFETGLTKQHPLEVLFNITDSQWP